MKTIGFDDPKKYFANIDITNLAPVSFLLSGPEMIGKKMFTLELAHLWNDSQQKNDADMLLVESIDEPSISIEQIRNIQTFLSRRPMAGRFTIAIIDDAHRMTTEAQNALLKVLEEPSQSSVIFLVSHQPFLLLDTIYSRCQEISFNKHSRADVLTFLEESIFSKAQKDFLADLADGRIGLIDWIIRKEIHKSIKGDIETIAKIHNMPLAERFKKLESWCQTDIPHDLERKILLQLLYFYQHRHQSGTERILRNLLNFYTLSGQGRYNQRLARDAFALRFSYDN